MHPLSMRLLVLALAVGGLAPAVVLARGDMAACRADVARFCSGIAPGGGRLAQCLREHASELSAPCKQLIAERRARGGRGPGGPGVDWSACRKDVARLCPEAVGDREKMRACMREHAAELSSECKSAVATFRQQRRAREPAR